MNDQTLEHIGSACQHTDALMNQLRWLVTYGDISDEDRNHCIRTHNDVEALIDRLQVRNSEVTPIVDIL